MDEQRQAFSHLMFSANLMLQDETFELGMVQHSLTHRSGVVTSVHQTWMGNEWGWVSLALVESPTMQEVVSLN